RISRTLRLSCCRLRSRIARRFWKRFVVPPPSIAVVWRRRSTCAIRHGLISALIPPSTRPSGSSAFWKARRFVAISRPPSGRKRTMARRRKGRNINGWLVIDKPSGMTSTEVVNRVRRLLDARKVGHGGSLDPLATGLLPLAFGEATKTVAWVMEGEKTYRFTVRWGEATDSDDAEGEVVSRSDRRPSRDEIEAVLRRFSGPIDQTTPIYSAIKVDGQRAYDLARDGEEIALKSRKVHIIDFKLIEMPDRDHGIFEVTSGKGAYMRSLARDLGEALGCLGHIAQL